MRKKDLEKKIEILENKLKRQELILENASSLVFLTNEENKIIDVYGDQSSLHKPKEEILNKNFEEILPKNATNIIKQAHKEAKLNGFSKQEYKLNESYYLIKTRYSEGFFSHCVNEITKEKKSENIAKEKTKLLEKIINNLFDMISFTDLQGNFTYVGGTHDFLGYSSSELLEKNVMDLVHPNDLERVQEEFTEFMTKLKPKRVEYRYKTSRNEYVWLDTQGNILFDDNNNPTRFIFSSRDITKRKEIEERFKNYILSAPISIFTINNEGKYTFTNKVLENLLGYSKEELENLTIRDTIDTNEKNNMVKSFHRLKKNEKENNFQTKLKRKDNSTIDVILDGIKIKDNEYLAFARDITKLNKTIKEKEILINEIHHRVKNNMQLIRSMIYLQKENKDSTPENTLERIDNRIIAMSKAYQCIYEQQQQNLDKINSQIYIKSSLEELFSTYNINDKIKLNYQIDDLEIDFDTAMPIGIIINEIVSNSLKYAFKNKEEGQILVKLKTNKEKKIEELIIQDDGIGFNKEEPGFGTYICDILSKQVGLNLYLETEINNGTKYTLKNEEIKEQVTNNFGNIILVEDEAIIALSRKKELQNSGYIVEDFIPNSGEKLIHYLNETKKEPQLILMDVGLAGNLDGIQTALEIRKNYQTPIIFVSGYSGTTEFEEKIKDIYNSESISKTATKDLLKEKIDKFLK